jgi:hypothetical protein
MGPVRPASNRDDQPSPPLTALPSIVRLTPGLSRHLQVVLGTFGYMALLAFALGLLIVVGCTNQDPRPTQTSITTFGKDM